MATPGYAGSILYVDLTAKSVREEALDTEMARTYLGGAGIIGRLAYDLIDPAIDPLTPASTIIMGTGPFNGTMIPGSSELMVLYKSPLSGAFPYSCGGGRFSHFLKSCGYDYVVITGRSEKPVYLKINDENVQLCDAGDLWGQDSIETADELRRRHEPCRVIHIGPAGENLVAISVAQIDKGGLWAQEDSLILSDSHYPPRLVPYLLLPGL